MVLLITVLTIKLGLPINRWQNATRAKSRLSGTSAYCLSVRFLLTNRISLVWTFLTTFRPTDKNPTLKLDSLSRSNSSNKLCASQTWHAGQSGAV